ncbi:FHA domain-containing protein [Corynebacterium camporealensis]|uniref:FHA domain-containing protein n=1 Tax=Corynebacterium camporealensis TaxID=161896 RepID=A0A0F6QU64_9CORY|nr:FHA domain-containing protein [Corynebacterium camporealensis]AKE38042.1 FHA domain-containing protein [Corynebacterium camporealensis]AVH87372.1 FHA domain-containing protein [Corynebacterium camporealensis]
MDSVVLLALRIGLLVLLWLFILVALNAMRRDANKAAGVYQASSAPRRSDARKETPRQISIVDGPLRGSHMELGRLEDCTLGRAQDCDFVTGDDYSSGHHARLFRRGSEWFVEDLESRNGTFVSGVRIDQPERVGVDTDIKLGRTTVRLMA